MKRLLLGLCWLLAVAMCVLLVIRWQRAAAPADPPTAAPAPEDLARRSRAAAPEFSAAALSPAPEAPHAPSRELTAAEKAAQVAQIKKDYDEIRAKTAADYTAAAANFPGGLNAYLRQLALLEREKRADLAALLSPRELEDLELRDTNAGQMVQRLLGHTAATEEQRRAVFQLQREFDERFALTFDLSPRALLERERIRHETQEQIRAVLGDRLFAEWLRGEGPDYANFVKLAEQQGLTAEVPLHLWRVKNEFTQRRLELSAQHLPAAQLRAAQAALVHHTEARVLAILGPAAMAIARREVLGWLPANRD